jgi:hypothetical protein
MRLQDETGRELSRVYARVDADEAEAVLYGIQQAVEGVRLALESDDAATAFMFIIGEDDPEVPPPDEAMRLH